jgi:hypothetical protein
MPALRGSFPKFPVTLHNFLMAGGAAAQGATILPAVGENEGTRS